jgi:hypothetical protein
VNRDKLTPLNEPLQDEEEVFLPSLETLRKIKSEVVHIGCNGTRTGFLFAAEMFRRYPELLREL